MKIDKHAWINKLEKKRQRSVITSTTHVTATTQSKLPPNSAPSSTAKFTMMQSKNSSSGNIKKYNEQFFDLTITDARVRRLIDHCMNLRMNHFTILKNPEGLSMPQLLQDSIMKHIEETQIDGELENYVAFEIIKKFTLTDQQLYSPQIGSHDGIVKVLNGRLGFEDMKEIEKQYLVKET